MKFLTALFSVPVLLVAVALLVGAGQSHATCGTPFDPPETLTITLGQVFTNPGDTFEIPIFLNAENQQPSTLDLWISYDPTKVEPFGEFYEEVIDDGNGGVIVTRSLARPEAVLDGLGKVIATNVHEDDGVIIIILSQGADIPDGHILTVPFRALPGALPNDVVEIDGVATDEEVEFFASNIGQTVRGQSSAAQGANCFDIACVDGEVQMTCIPVAETPGNVSATQGNMDKVTISWDPILTALAQYRVYRSLSSDFSEAVPLGPGWSTDTSFDDFSASEPTEMGGAGCAPQVVEVHYWYWVVARTPAGCEGNFSSPAAEGWRGAPPAKLAQQQAGTASLQGIAIPVMLLVLSLLWRRRAVGTAA